MRKFMIILGILLALTISVTHVQAIEYKGETSESYPHSRWNYNIWTLEIWSEDSYWTQSYSQDKDQKKKVKPAKKVGNYASVNIQIKWRAYTLYGEPVFITRAKWDLQKVRNNYAGSIYLKKWDKEIGKGQCRH